MNKINNIYTFGTSQTAGGGFEFESPADASGYKGTKFCKSRGDALKYMYKDIGEELTQFNFSWPGQLQKILGNEIKVTNLAKSGYGNERMYRLTYDLIRNNIHKLDSMLFIYEFSYLGRKEYYLNELNDYIIVNYGFPNPDDKIPVQHGIAIDYFFDENPIIYNHSDFFNNIVQKTINFDEQLKLMRMNQLTFLSFLKTIGANFLISMEPWDDNKIHADLINFDEYQIDFYQYTRKHGNPLAMNLNTSISAETNGEFYDGHNGIIMNNFIGACVYNELVDRKLIDSNKLNIHRPKEYSLENIKLFLKSNDKNII